MQGGEERRRGGCMDGGRCREEDGRTRIFDARGTDGGKREADQSVTECIFPL